MVAAPVARAKDTLAFAPIGGQTLAPLDAFRECAQCPEMIVMPPGSFQMGAQEGESRNPFDLYGAAATGRVRGPDEVNIIPHEHPRHAVVMDIPYAISRNETTYAEWMVCVAEGGCAHVPDHRVLLPGGQMAELGPDHPVINVSYLDALEFVGWLNAQTGSTAYRLPTEAEWEYAARAGTQTRFAQGEELTAEQANFSREATEHVQKKPMPQLQNRWQPVRVQDLSAANGWGLRHMSGNVEELTLTCWTDTHLGLASDSAYLRLAQSQGPCRRVAKGGSFNKAMDGLRLAARTRPNEDRRRNNRGFRVMRELTGE